MLVLIVEDEPVARMLYLSVLARMRDVSAVGASTVAEARSIIAEAQPQVVILDMQLPDGSGLDVVAALEQRQINATLIVITAYLEKWKGQISSRERIHWLGKPVPIPELRRLIEAAVHTAAPPGPFSPLDYVQLACMGQHSAVFECTSAEGSGEIVVEKGLIWSAKDEQGAGADAFNRLALRKGWHVRVLPERQSPGPRNLEERWELLALDAIRVADEAARPVPAKAPLAVSAAAPAPLAKTAPLLEATDADFSACVDKALRAVVARDFATAHSEFERALAMRPDDPLVRHRLERLRMLRTRQEF